MPRWNRVERKRFVKLVMEVLDDLPEEFRKRIHNLAVLVDRIPAPGIWTDSESVQFLSTRIWFQRL